MNEKYSRTMDDLLDMFSSNLEPADVLSSKLMAQVSAAITKERLRLHMSQQEFAKYLDVPQSLISRWEHGDYNFSIRKIAEIMARLNFDVDFSIKPFEEKTTSNVKTYYFYPTRDDGVGMSNDMKLEVV